MSSRLRINTAALIVLTCIFLFAKFNLVRLRVPAFRTDPCDAVAAFAGSVILLALVASLRGSLSYHKEVAYTTQNSRVLRSQQAVAVAMFITVLAHLVALARHPSMLGGAPWRNQLFVWLAVYAAAPVAAELLVLTAQSNRTPAPSSQRNRAVLSCLLGVAALVFCPEYGAELSSETAHILTVIVGALIALVPTGYLLPVLVPCESGERSRSEPFFNTRIEKVALLIGILLGVFVFWVDAHRTGSGRHLVPALKFVNYGLVIAYAFFAESLGLTASKRVNQ